MGGYGRLALTLLCLQVQGYTLPKGDFYLTITFPSCHKSLKLELLIIVRVQALGEETWKSSYFAEKGYFSSNKILV